VQGEISFSVLFLFVRFRRGKFHHGLISVPKRRNFYTTSGSKRVIVTTPDGYVLTGWMKRILIVQGRQPQGYGCRAYMEVLTACIEQ